MGVGDQAWGGRGGGGGIERSRACPLVRCFVFRFMVLASIRVLRCTASFRERKPCFRAMLGTRGFWGFAFF